MSENPGDAGLGEAGSVRDVTLSELKEECALAQDVRHRVSDAGGVVLHSSKSEVDCSVGR